MKCCGHELTSIELQVSDQPYKLFRCGDCNSGYWLRDGQQVPSIRSPPLCSARQSPVRPVGVDGASGLAAELTCLGVWPIDVQ